MTDSIRFTDRCINKGLQYLEKPLQIYWPAKIDSSGRLNPVAENNIALHLARSFTEAGFLVWAEIPSSAGHKRLDFFAYCDTENIAVALELKRSIDMPPSGSREDLKKLADLHYSAGLANADAAINSAEWIYGIVTVLYANAFVTWWENPEGYDYEQSGRYLRSADYKKIGQGIAKAHRNVVPLGKWDNIAAAYALYDKNSIAELKMVMERA
ncbi:hypothetical protein LJC15_00455 [Desulfovibrio sp. OttesenSCG-928-G11]|nr:hypothetical protein [Desulfovibrio sp. OttesenSCG-928-G11]